VFIRPSDLTAHRSAKAFRTLRLSPAWRRWFCLAFMMGLDRSPIANLNALAHRPPSITDTMQADDEAARTRTLSAYTHAADVMVCVAAEATVRHRPVPSTHDQVSLDVSGGIGPRRARSMAEFAVMQYLSVRTRFMSPEAARSFSVAVYDFTGRRMGSFNARSV